MAYIRAAEIGMEIGQSNAAWMLSRGYGAQGPAAATLAMKLHQRAAGQVCTCLHMFCAHDSSCPPACSMLLSYQSSCCALDAS